LRGELPSVRFGQDIRACLASCGQPERLLTCPDLSGAEANAARRRVLAAARGYGEDRELFTGFPAQVTWIRAVLLTGEIARVHYMDYSYWYEISGGSRLPADAAARNPAGIQAWDVPNERFTEAARALARGEQFPPLILAGENQRDLACLEGRLRLTACALAGFPVDVECLVGTAPTMGRHHGGRAARARRHDDRERMPLARPGAPISCPGSGTGRITGLPRADCHLRRLPDHRTAHGNSVMTRVQSRTRLDVTRISFRLRWLHDSAQ
jgi:hypothetical protein